jgi:hypothetical protein
MIVRPTFGGGGKRFYGVPGAAPGLASGVRFSEILPA